MRTTAEQRATMRAALADETYADLNRDEVRDVLALLDDLDEVLAESTHRGETLERVAEAVGYPRGAHYGDVLGRIDELVAERDRLRAAVDGVLADVARWREHTEARARGGQHVGTSGEIGQLSHSTAEYLERTLGRHVGGGSREVRAAGGGDDDTKGGLGAPGLRDPAAPCAEYAPGPGHGDCETDGHYLCRGCSRRAAGGGT